jgi:hypothetical protein
MPFETQIDLVAAVPRRLVGYGPGGILTTADHCRKEAALLILANDFYLLLIASHTKRKGLPGSNYGTAQLIVTPFVSIHA